MSWARAALCDQSGHFYWRVAAEASALLSMLFMKLKPGSLPALSGPWLQMLLMRHLEPITLGLTDPLQGHSRLLAFGGLELGGEVLIPFTFM